MVLETAKKQGTPNWADCGTFDLEAAEKFYAAVFGWTSERVAVPDAKDYSIQRLDGNMVCGIYELNQEIRDMGVPPHWGTYVEVDDLDATLELVKAEGGTVLEGPIEDPAVGTIAFIQDPVGAYLRLWHSKPEHGGEVFNIPGSMTWNELMTREPEKAAKFYENVLGVKAKTTEGPRPYTALNIGDRAVAGILHMTPEMGEMPSSWDVYFATDDVGATVEKAIAAGGKVLKGPFDIPQAGRMAVIQDPQGAVFEVIKMVMQS